MESPTWKCNGHGAVSVESEMLSYAFGVVSEYIRPDLAEKLMRHLGLTKTTASAASKRKSVNNVDPMDAKRIKTEDFNSIDNNLSLSNVATVEKKQSSKEKQLAKAASGTKSISSFFTKK